MWLINHEFSLGSECPYIWVKGGHSSPLAETPTDLGDWHNYAGFASIVVCCPRRHQFVPLAHEIAAPVQIRNIIACARLLARFDHAKNVACAPVGNSLRGFADDVLVQRRIAIMRAGTGFAEAPTLLYVSSS